MSNCHVTVRFPVLALPSFVMVLDSYYLNYGIWKHNIDTRQVLTGNLTNNFPQYLPFIICLVPKFPAGPLVIVTTQT